MAHLLKLRGRTPVVNLLTNPRAETGDTTGWSARATNNDTGSFVTVDTPVDEGDLAFKLTRDTDAGGVNSIYIDQAIEGIVAGQAYSMSARVRAATNARTCSLSLVWRDASDTLISVEGGGSAQSDMTTSWTTLSIDSVEAPVGAVSVNVRVNVADVPEGESHYIDSIALVEGAMPARYPDGSLDLTDYLRIAQDQGMDADVGGFLQPQFGDAPLGEGQPLLSVTSQVKEKIYPLALNDATPAEMVALQRLLVWQCTQNGPLVLEETPDGSDTLHWDVAFAHFEPETNVRRAQHGWKLGTLHVHVQPYATTGTTRLVATGVASGGFVVQTGPVGSLAGDVPGLLDITVKTGAGTIGLVPGRAVAVAALPHPSYQVFHGASRLAVVDAGATLRADPLAPASLALRGLTGSSIGTVGIPFAKLHLAPASVYQGRNRLMAVARTLNTPGAALRAFIDSEPVGPTAIASAMAGYGLVDLGTFDVPAGYPGVTLALDLDAGQVGTGFFGRWWGSDLSLGGLVVLPEGRSSLLIDGKQSPLAYDNFTETQATTSVTVGGTIDDLGNEWLAAPGAGLHRYPSGFLAPGPSTLHDGQALVNIGQPIRDIRVEAQGYVGKGGPSPSMGMLEVLKVPGTVGGGIPSIGVDAIFARVMGAASPWLHVFIASSVQASMTIPSLAASQAVTLTLESQGDTITARLRQVGATAVLAELQATGAAAMRRGMPGVWLHDFALTASQPVRLVGMRAAELPPEHRSPREQYQFDAIDGRVDRLTPSGAWDLDVTGRAHGHTPAAPAPTLPAVAALALPLDGGNANTSLEVEVRVRERFTFAR